MGKGAFQGEESVLADSGLAGEVIAGVGQVRRATFSASCRENFSDRMGGNGMIVRGQAQPAWFRRAR